MGSNHSTSNYSRLPPYPHSPNRPLLDHPNKAQQEEEIEADRDNSMSLEKTIKGIKSSISKLEKAALVQQPVKKEKASYSATLEMEVNQLKLRVSNLETMSPSHNSLIKKQEKKIERIKKQNDDLERKVLELTSTIQEMKRSTAYPNMILSAADSDHVITNTVEVPDLIDMDYVPVPPTTNIINTDKNDLISNMIADPDQSCYDLAHDSYLLNDLIGCVVVLIFLVAFLIGICL